MPWIVCRKPSGVHYVALIYTKDEAILYEVAVRKLFSVKDEAELECKKLEKERVARHKKLRASQLKLLDIDAKPSLEYP